VKNGGLWEEFAFLCLDKNIWREKFRVVQHVTRPLIHQLAAVE
jgi:hypothetical protein